VRGDDAEQFVRAWQRHYVEEAVATERPADIDLPDDWRSKVDGFHGAGLSQARLLDAIEITMAREDVANDGLFPYFCGVCWHMIRAERGQVGGPPPRSPARDELPKMPRSLVRTVACPSCGAAPGERCVGSRGKLREANHAERVLAADAATRATYQQ
jgi:hypothetical protein